VDRFARCAYPEAVIRVDEAWFAQHPGREYRLRTATADEREQVVEIYGETALEVVIVVRRHAGLMARGYGLGEVASITALADWLDAAPEAAAGAVDWMLREAFRGMAAAAGTPINEGGAGWLSPAGRIQ
jgi:hypothetical protein